MFHFPITTTLLFASFVFKRGSSSVVQASGTSTKALNFTYSTLNPTITDKKADVQSHNQSYIRSQNPQNTTAVKSSGKGEGHEDASINSSSLYTSLPDLGKTCVLWNTSCLGNKTYAMDQFFTNTSLALYSDSCFLDPLTGCINSELAERSPQYKQIKSWMKSPQCYSDLAEWSPSMFTSPPMAVVDATPFDIFELEQVCCEGCAITAGNVEVYYWPEANASTACLDIVGNGTYPLDYGATTEGVKTYWGCTGQNSSVIATAYLTEVNYMKVKGYYDNPWSLPSCSATTSSSINPATFTRTHNTRPNVFARAHSIIVKSSFHATDPPITTAVVGSFTFTSPSIYANFHNLWAGDICGAGTEIKSTMLTFSPGELSTIAGGFQLGGGNPDLKKPFDFRDLPCPPQSVMEANWYKPQPGDPYRPLIDLPKQVRDIRPEWSTCDSGLFFGIDPPRSLMPATAMVPITTSRGPESINVATAMPNPRPHTGARNTATDRASTRAPSSTPTVKEPKETNSLIAELKQGTPDPRPQLYGPVLDAPQVDALTQPGIGPQEGSSDFRQQSSVSDNSTPRNNQNPNLPVQAIASIPTIESSDLAPKSTPPTQASDPPNGIPTVIGPEPNPPFAHLPGTAFATNDTPQDPSPTNQDHKPDTPEIAGVDDLKTLQSAMDAVRTVDSATYQHHLDPSSNLVIASQAVQASGPSISVARAQIGLPLSANDIIGSGNHVPIAASAPVASTVAQHSGSSILANNEFTLPFSSIEDSKSGTSSIGSPSSANDVVRSGNHVPIAASASAATTVPQNSGSSILGNNEFTLPFSSIEDSKSGTSSIASQATTAAVMLTEGVVSTPLSLTPAITRVEGTLATPSEVASTLKTGAPEPSERTHSSEALKTGGYGTGDHSSLDSPTGKVGSTTTGTQILEGRARKSLKSRTLWKKVGLTGFLMGMVFDLA